MLFSSVLLLSSDFERDSMILIKSLTFNEFVGKNWKCLVRAAFRSTMNASEATECSWKVEETAGLTCSLRSISFYCYLDYYPWPSCLSSKLVY